MSFIKTFDQVIKHNFDQTPVLLENFDQVIRSSEIRSSDPLSSTAGSELENFILKFPRLFVCLQMFYFFAILYKHLPGFPPFCLSV